MFLGIDLDFSWGCKRPMNGFLLNQLQMFQEPLSNIKRDTVISSDGIRINHVLLKLHEKILLETMQTTCIAESV